jgi:DNA-binding transcriptional LysR family regulator
VSLTPEGELLLPMAHRVVHDFEAVVADLRDHADRRRGKVAIAALPSLAAEWLPKIIAEFGQRYPGIKVQLFDGVLDQMLALVREGSVDFAVNADVGHEEEFETQPLFNDAFYLVCLPSHLLAKRKNIKLRQPAGEAYIHTNRSASMWRLLYPFLHEVSLRDTGFEVRHLSTLAGLVANGLGISVVTGVSLFNFTRLGLAAVPISDRGLRYEVRIVKRRGRSFSVAARALVEMLEGNKPSLPGR